MIKYLLVLNIILSNISFSAGSSVKVIYGTDDRRDVFENRDPRLTKLARSTAAMIGSSNLIDLGNGLTKIVGQTLEESGKCSTEKFAAQLAVANCSGFLIGKNLIATAGHCIETQIDCDKSKWVFGYKVDYKTQDEVTVYSSQVYKCKKVISRSLDDTTQNDYAVIELEEEVEGRDILEVRQAGAPKVGDEIVVIGHPSGLPSKITSNAFIRSVNDVFFVTNLDTYGGNSGSAVFNATTGIVEGILVRGDQDYKWDASGGCLVSNVIGEASGRGEDVTLAKSIAEFAVH